MAWRRYMADMLCLNVQSKCDERIPLFSEIVMPQEKKKETAEEIFEKVMGKLDGMSVARKE